LCNQRIHDNNTPNMIVFLVALMPLFYWQIQYLYNNDNVRFTDRILPFFFGLVLSIPVILAQWALDVYFPLKWSAMGIYLYTFFNKEGFIVYPVLIILFLYFRKKSYNGIPLREITGWFAGFYFMISLSEALVLTPAVNPYTALINPLCRLFYIMLLSVFLVRALHDNNKKMKIFYLAGFFSLPLILNTLPVLNLLNKNLFFYLLFLLTGAVSVVLYMMENRGKFD